MRMRRPRAVDRGTRLLAGAIVAASLVGLASPTAAMPARGAAATAGSSTFTYAGFHYSASITNLRRAPSIGGASATPGTHYVAATLRLTNLESDRAAPFPFVSVIGGVPKAATPSPNCESYFNASSLSRSRCFYPANYPDSPGGCRDTFLDASIASRATESYDFALGHCGYQEFPD